MYINDNLRIINYNSILDIYSIIIKKTQIITKFEKEKISKFKNEILILKNYLDNTDKNIFYNLALRDMHIKIIANYNFLTTNCYDFLITENGYKLYEEISMLSISFTPVKI